MGEVRLLNPLATALKNVNFDGKVKGEKWSTREQAYRDALRVCPERAEGGSILHWVTNQAFSQGIECQYSFNHVALSCCARKTVLEATFRQWRGSSSLWSWRSTRKTTKLRVALSAALDAMIKHCLTLSVVWDHVEKFDCGKSSTGHLGVDGAHI